MSPVALATQPDSDSAAYRLGYRELSGAFTCFSHLLLRHGRQRGSRHMAFVARDGDLLMRCTARLIERLGDNDQPTLSYVNISRRTSFLPALGTIDAEMLGAAFEVRGNRARLSEALAYLGMSLAPIAPVLARLAIDPEKSDASSEAISTLVADEQFQLAVRRESDRQRALLAAYLKQENIGTGAATLLVDIGWRGSILTNLQQAFSRESAFEPPAGAFLGLWSEGKALPEFPAGTIGLLADIRRRRNALEASPWFAAFLLEAVCRANEGTTIGYEILGNKVAPILAGDSESRKSEEKATPIVAEIRRGILDFIEEHGTESRWLTASDDMLRRRAQNSLLRLACFPQAQNLAIGARLVHTEGHTPDWWIHLVDPVGANPVLHPRRWLAGLASPWRTGYIHHTGGPILAAGFLILESLLLACPPDVRTLLTRTARKSADGSFRTTYSRHIP